MDQRKFLKSLEKDHGLTIVRSHGGHYKVYRGDRLLTTLSFSPSDSRTHRNQVATLRRMGVSIPR